jgi:general secretion pathway protein L
MISDRVGLDIGHTSIKAVRLKRSFTGQESVTYFKQDLTAPLDAHLGHAHTLADQLRRFIKTNRLHGAEVVTALPCRDLFVRTLALPFRDPKKLVQVVPFEVENLIPLPLEEVAVDYQVLGSLDQTGTNGNENGTDVLVAAVPRVTLAQHVQLMKEAGIEPSLIDVDALALYSLMQHLEGRGMTFPPDLALIDIGASQTTVCLTHQGRPSVIRTIAWGGQQLTQALANRQGCSQAEAEERKKDMSARELEPWLTSLVRDLQITLHGYETTTKTRLSRFWLTGGGAELQDLPAWLGEELEMQPLEPDAKRDKLCPPSFAMALGLAVKPQRLKLGARLGIGQQTSVAINLNRVTASAQAAEGARPRELWVAAAALASLLILGFADLSVSLFLKERRAQELTTVLQSRFREQFPGLDPGVDEVDQAKSALAAVNKTLSLIGGDQPGLLPLLRELTQRVPKGLALTLSALTVERGTIQLDAETDSFDSVEKVKRGLQAFPGVQEVTVSETRVGATPNQVRFRVSMTLQKP